MLSKPLPLPRVQHSKTIFVGIRDNQLLTPNRITIYSANILAGYNAFLICTNTIIICGYTWQRPAALNF